MKQAKPITNLPTPAEAAVKQLLLHVGENPEREGLEQTPRRVAKLLKYLSKGYEEDPKAVIEGATFVENYDEMIVVKDIDFYSLCEHHLLPFFGQCHVAYIPNKKIVGLSKIARLVEIFARRLQVQERMTNEIAKTIQDVLEPKGVGVVVHAQHLCMQMRGVEKQNSVAVTSSMLGAFRTRQETRNEFLRFLPANT